ncbi:type I DNA topoisomerase [bacterium]|nr:type I DNA topoisomerase [bacterium]
MSATKLLIVESPSKAKTIKKYLGSSYYVKASVGHIKDLPANRMGIKIDQDFEPVYTTVKGKTELLKELKKLAKEVDSIYIGTDPDREGEAIAYHLYNSLEKVNKNIYRVLFNEITKKSVKTAISQATTIDMQKVNAQQARRVLDRIVGYKLSPLLWKKVGKGLSAGRVQSVATKIIVDREDEIIKFQSVEYWNIKAHFKKDNTEFIASLFQIDDKKLDTKNFRLEDKGAADTVLTNLSKKYVVSKIEEKQRKQEPLPPFTTSKLQQEASSKFGFSAKKTMLIAQKLYEGIDIANHGTTGLITYMRTDSVRISDDAIKSLRDYIELTYGSQILSTSERRYKGKKNIQDAHEAIRPTNIELSPNVVQSSLSDEEFKLYKLIWSRFLVTQMKEALFSKTVVDIKNGNYLFRASGEVIIEKGYLEHDSKGKAEATTLPLLKEKESLKAEKTESEQKFTQPPARYTEASLIKKLEDEGIGRPSTYATIVSTILDRDYVVKEEGKFKPSDIGVVVTKQLASYFDSLINIDFTSKLEDELDQIESGEKEYLETLKKFYDSFATSLEYAEKEMPKTKLLSQETDIKCDKCGAIMMLKQVKKQKFLACSSYPECKNIKNFKQDADGTITVVEKEIQYSETPCPTCGKRMIITKGPYGNYLRCEDYPDCKTTQPITLDISCPKDGCDGKVVEKRSRKGKIFYSCSNYPKCDFVSWYKPVNEECPKCKSSYLIEKYSKKTDSVKIACPEKTCGFVKKEQ